MPSVLERVRARPATLVAAALLVLGIWEIGTLAAVKAGAPTDDDWRAIAAHVDAAIGAAAGEGGRDLVVFAPEWADPVGRRFLGGHLGLDDLGRMDAAGYARIWEISQRGAHAAETRGLGAPVETRGFGALTLRRYAQKPATVSWQAHATGEILEVAHRPRRCLRGMGRRELRAVALGSELVVYAGLADVWARKENQAFARVQVYVDGTLVAETSVGNSSGWRALPRVATTPGVHDVAIDVSVDPARGNAQKARLDVCIAAEGRTP